MMNPEVRKGALVGLLINPLPASAREPLLADEAFCAELGITPHRWLGLGEDQLVEAGSLYRALRAALAGRKTSSVKLKGDKSDRRIRVKLSTEKGGTATISFRKQRFTFADADLLSTDRRIRLNALNRVMKERLISAESEQFWRDTVESRALSDGDYDKLLGVLDSTPEAFSADVRELRILGADSLMPDDPEYYENLVARLENSRSLVSFIEDELATTRRSLVSRSPSHGLRRTAFLALWRPLIPFDLHASLSKADIQPLQGSEDPFSLLFGFEMCAVMLEKDPEIVELGASFLDKLLGDTLKSERRIKLFSACALITTTELRRAAKAPTAPTFWVRLAALAHAGVITDALSGLEKPEGFWCWTNENLLPTYIWHGVVDRHEAPRWNPEWISPDILFAELVGRVSIALLLLPEDKRPEKWVSLLRSAVTRLEETGTPLAAAFPGPFDDFQPTNSSASQNEAFKAIKSQLETAEHFDEVPGLFALAYTTLLTKPLIDNVLRILKLMLERPVIEATTEVQYLQLASHIALTTRSTQISEIVINRCLNIAAQSDEKDTVSRLFLIITEACGAHETDLNFRTMLGQSASELCLAVNQPNLLKGVVGVFDVLTRRDEKLLPALAKARAIARTKILQ